MPRRLLTPIVFSLLLLAWAPIRAADNALEAISSEASVAIRLKNPKAAIAKTKKLAESVSKEFGDFIGERLDDIGELISNPKLAGVDMESDWWVAVYAESGKAEPDVVFIVPAKDLNAMKEALGSDVKFMDKGKLGIYTNDADAAAKTAARLKGEGKSISTLMDKDSSGLFENGDVSVFVNLAQLATSYKSEIEGFKDQLTQQLEMAGQFGAAGGAPFNTKQIAEALGKVFSFLVQGLDDSKSCTMAALVSNEGLFFEDLVKLKGDSATDKLLSKSQPGALAAISSLPPGNLGYFGLTWDMSDFEQLSQWVFGAAGLPAETEKEVKGALDEAAKLKIGSIVTAFGLGEADEGAMRSVSVTEVDNPPKMRDVMRKVTKIMGKVEQQGIKQNVELKTDAEKYGKNSADVVTVKQEFDEGQNPLMAQSIEKMNSAMFGPDGMTTRIVYLKDRVVQTMGGGKKAMTDALALIEKPSTNDSKSPVQQARAKLGQKSNVLLLIDLPNFVRKFFAFMLESGAFPFPLGDPDQMKDLDIKPSFFGLSASTEAQGLRVKTNLSLEQMKGIAKLVKFFQGLAGGAEPAEEL